MRILVAVVFFSFLFSCSKEITVPGVYTRKFETLNLKRDSTYEYMYRVERPQLASKGTWKIIGEDKIEVNSFYNLNNLPVEVKESIDLRETYLFEIVPQGTFYSDMRHNIEFGIVINGKEIARMSNALIEVPVKEDIRTMEVNIYYVFNDLPVIHVTRESLSTELYNVRSGQATVFKIKFPLESEMFYSETVEGDTIRVKRDKLFWLRKGDSYFKKKN